jgi:hypothetical protein
VKNKLNKNTSDILFHSKRSFSTGQIRDRQSVRTTFKLKKETFDTMAWLSNYHDIPKKDLIDYAVVNLPEDLGVAYKTLLEKADVIFKEKTDDSTVYVRKTQVVTRKTLKILKNLSKELNEPRDKLVESSINILNMVCQHQIEDHKKALKKIEELYSHIDATRVQLIELLDDEDPVLMRFNKIISSFDRLNDDICSEISNGEPIDPYGI